MKARKVKLDPGAPFADGLRAILHVRLDELFSFAPAVADPANVRALHDMRIAAKRVRYVLEIGEPVLGRPARRGLKVAKGLQELLGEIHDCDELLPMIRSHHERLRAEDLAAVRAGARGDLDPARVRDAPNRTRYRGLESLATYVAARREVLYARFAAEWARVAESDFRESLERAPGPEGRLRAVAA